MITHEIKQKPPSVLDWVFGRNPVVPTVVEKRPENGALTMHSWDKVKFIRWIEEVKVKWPVGKLVIYQPPSDKKDNVAHCYKITDVLELYSHTLWDNVNKEPRALVIHKKDCFYTVSPSEIRDLSPEEYKLVNL